MADEAANPDAPQAGAAETEKPATALDPVTDLAEQETAEQAPPAPEHPRDRFKRLGAECIRGVIEQVRADTNRQAPSWDDLEAVFAALFEHLIAGDSEG